MHSVMGVSIRYREAEGGWVVRITHKGKRREQGGFGHGPEGKARAEKYADEVRHASELADDWSNSFPGSPCPIEQLCKGWLVVYGPLRISVPQNVGVFWHFVDVVWVVLFLTIFVF